MVGEGSISWTVGFAGIEQAKAAWVAYRQEVAATIQAQGQLVQTMGGGGQVLATIASNAATAAKNYQALTGSLSQLSAGFSQVTSSGSGLSGALANVAAQAKTTQQAMSTLPTTIQAVFKAPAGGGAISGQMRLLNADLTALKANAASGVAPLANIANSLNQIGPASANAAGGMQ